MASGSKKRQIDFTQGAIVPAVIAFVIPLILSEAMQNLYHTVDSLVVGRLLGQGPLAAVTICSQISNMLIGFFTGMSIGSSVIVSRAFGDKLGGELPRTSRVVYNFSAILGVILSGAGFLLAPALLRMVNTPEEIYSGALSDLKVYMISLVFIILYNIASGILRAIGDSRSPFYVLVFTSILHIGMDFLFVGALGMGIMGVATATFIAQGISAVMTWMQLRKSIDDFGFRYAEIAQNRGLIGQFMSIGLPSGFQSSLISFSNMFVQRYINGFGTAVISGAGIELRVDKFMNYPGKSFGSAVTTIISQNDGAGTPDRAKKACNICVRMALGMSVVLCAIFVIFAEPIIGFFTEEPDVLAIGVRMLRILGPFYTVLVIREHYVGILRGHGDTRTPMILNVIGMIVFRQIFLAVGLHLYNDPVIIYWCYPTAWIVTAALSWGYYALKKDQFFVKRGERA